jgi:hypothetical protein
LFIPILGQVLPLVTPTLGDLWRSWLLWLSVALAIGTSGVLPLWRSICLHISKPFSGGMVFYFFIFILCHYITRSPRILIIVSLFLLHLVASCPPLLGGYLLLPWRLSALVRRYFWTFSRSAFLVQRSS